MFSDVWTSQVALVVKNLPANVGDTGDVGSIPGSRRSPEEGNGNPLQDSCPENPMSRSLEIYSPESHKRVKYDLMTKYHFIF